VSRADQALATPRPVTLASAADYIALAKPRVVLMIVLVTATGYYMGAVGGVNLIRLAHALIGTALVAAGTLALNMYLERDRDAMMHRTLNRPLPGNRMRPGEALLFGGALAAAGLAWLTLFTRPLAGFFTALTVILYLFAYTPLKTRSALCTVVGAFPGALPPVTGWMAAREFSGAGDVGAMILFAILFFWQLPHSLAIAWIYRDDYQRAGMKLLPTEGARGATGRQALLNAVTLFAVGLLPAAVGLAGTAYLVTAVIAGGSMLFLSAAFAVQSTSLRARRLLIASFFYVPAVMGMMAADKVWS